MLEIRLRPRRIRLRRCLAGRHYKRNYSHQFGSLPGNPELRNWFSDRHRFESYAMVCMTRLAGPLLACALAPFSASANAQAGATPPPPAAATVNQPGEISAAQPPAAQPPTASDICRAMEQDAAENALPVEFFARVIWQESRFNARAVSSKGAKGIAQFMPQTA